MADIEKEKLNSVSGHEEHEHCGCELRPRP